MFRHGKEYENLVARRYIEFLSPMGSGKQGRGSDNLGEKVVERKLQDEKFLFLQKISHGHTNKKNSIYSGISE
jgi:hypothetical protein